MPQKSRAAPHKRPAKAKYRVGDEFVDASGKLARAGHDVDPFTRLIVTSASGATVDLLVDGTHTTIERVDPAKSGLRKL
jgi:hypothetical protein